MSKKKDFMLLSKPTTIVLHTLDTEKMISYLDDVLKNKNCYVWKKEGVGKDQFNCATLVWRALQVGGIERLYKSNAKIFSAYSLSASGILLPIFYEYWQCLLACSLGMSVLGGILDAQIPAVAFLKIINANCKNSYLIYLAKSLIWFGEVLLSGISSGLTFGRVDNIMHKIYMTPEIIRMICFSAASTEHYCTLAPPRHEKNDMPSGVAGRSI